ncbi:pentapeptide repeat-containing protein [Streptomyces smyrnaeus]
MRSPSVVSVLKTRHDHCTSRFCGARLCGARLCGARLCGARLCGARLCGARLCGLRCALGAFALGALLGAYACDSLQTPPFAAQCTGEGLPTQDRSSVHAPPHMPRCAVPSAGCPLRSENSECTGGACAVAPRTAPFRPRNPREG